MREAGRISYRGSSPTLPEHDQARFVYSWKPLEIAKLDSFDFKFVLIVASKHRSHPSPAHRSSSQHGGKGTGETLKNEV
ncbi:hypothetical protein NLI96_g7922 [Meripilus lineatus]|uniref:Uncharacterized protein n=1 Tax=Meripilus lineatus TaxID=2056292 RepID=A0AAD5YBK7_9APHY|nr:hypothetical protein NLI96_g7922 [Physisporinus lineatus]